jgi:hypothetical protein
MNDYFDHLERAIVDSANRRAHISRRAPRLRLTTGPASRRVGAIAGAFAIAAVIALSLALGGIVQSSLPRGRSALNHPGAGYSHRLSEPWFRDFGRASSRTNEDDPSCANTPPPTTPVVSYGRPAKSITALFPLLGEPATRDHRVSVEQIKRLEFLGGVVAAAHVYIKYAWVGERDGVDYYELPAASLGLWPPPPSARCDHEVLTLFRHEIKVLPAATQREAIAWILHRFRQYKENEKPFRGICTIYVRPRAARAPSRFFGARAGVLCEGIGSLRTGPDLDQGGAVDSFLTTALVTGDVATVTAYYPAEHYRHSDPVRHPVTVTERVHHNFVVFFFHGGWDAPILTGRSETGKILWTYNPNTD